MQEQDSSLPHHHAVCAMNTLFTQMEDKGRQLFFDLSKKTDTVWIFRAVPLVLNEQMLSSASRSSTLEVTRFQQ
jgi:hypothetical protein